MLFACCARIAGRVGKGNEASDETTTTTTMSDSSKHSQPSAASLRLESHQCACACAFLITMYHAFCSGATQAQPRPTDPGRAAFIHSFIHSFTLLSTMASISIISTHHFHSRHPSMALYYASMLLNSPPSRSIASALPALTSLPLPSTTQ